MTLCTGGFRFFPFGGKVRRSKQQFCRMDLRHMANFEIARTKMVENQIRANKVMDERLVAAMRVTPRERYVPASRRGVAYADEDLSIGEGRTLMEPMLFGRLVQMADVGADDFVLDVGAGLGYGAAVLARIASAVIALEQSEGMAEAAKAALADDGDADAVVVHAGPLNEGWAPEAEYDVIICEGGIDVEPEALLGQLAEGGRLAAMQRGPNGIQRGTLFIKRNGAISKRTVFDGATPILPGFEAAPAFTF